MRRIRARMFVGGVVVGLTSVLGSVGCFPQQTNRAQVADDTDTDKDRFATIGSKTEIGNAESIPVSGVGLVYGLRGTGSSPPADGWRTMLESTLKKRQLDVKLLLDNPEKKTTLVLVSSSIPPGSRIGDKLDLLVTLPQGSKTTSLHNGVLDLCNLSNFEVAGNARQQLADSGMPTGKAPLASSSTLLMGSKLAIAEGPLVVGAIVNPKQTKPDTATGQDDDSQGTEQTATMRIAKVWNGTTCQIDRPYYFLIARTTPQPRLAMVLAARLNAVFHSGDRAGKIAEAKVDGGKPFVAVFVPPAYRHNHERFLMVARNVTINGNAPGDAYRKKLEQDLLQPHTAIEAAIKLEAIGSDAEDTLRIGLEKTDSPWVQFAAAQSLAYLGKANALAAAKLGELAEKHPALRTHCLLALASQDDAPCVDQLVELMRKPDRHLRYGAFTALRTADETHESIRGRRMGSSYWLHTIAPDSDSLVNLTTERRNEIVLFGSVWPLRGPFSFPLGNEFTITAKADSTSVTITRLAGDKRDKDDELATVTATHRADLHEVLKGLAALGGSYSEAIEFIGRANRADVLVVPLAIDSAPRGFAVTDLVRISSNDPQLEKANATVEKQKDGSQTGAPIVPADMPTDGDAIRAQPASEPALNRNHGSIFRPFEAEKLGPTLNRNPGTVFSK